MKSTAKLLLALLLLAASLQTSAKVNQTPVYIFGVAASFNDSIVYITDIQRMDSAWVDSKTKFLMSRYEYSYQLRDYLRAIGQPNMTCITFFKVNEKKIQKVLAAVKKRYTKKNRNFIIKELSTDDFAFTAPYYSEAEEQLINKKVEKRNTKKVRKPKK